MMNPRQIGHPAMGFRNNGSGGQDGAGRQGKDAYTHLWRTPGGDFPAR